MKTCGVCGNATTKKRDVILDFDMLSEIITFESKGRFGREKHQNLGVKVKVVADMVSGNTQMELDCIYMTKEYVEDMKKNNYLEYICGKYEEGRYAWILENIEVLDKLYRVMKIIASAI